MTMGRALRQARESKGMKQTDLGREIFVSDKAVSAYETGARRVPRQLTPSIVAKLDDAQLALEAAGEITGGMMPPVLDGPRADLHRVTTRDVMIQEMREALQSLESNRAILYARCGEELDDAGRRQVRDTLKEMAEAGTAIVNGIAVFCRVFGESPGELYQEHRLELAMKGFITYEEARRTA